MKIKAIRLSEVGLFSEPVALEGLTGGLDVLAGPNELGKSTLFRALSLLIGEKHTSAAKTVQALRPNAGGTPLIEADLELDGRTWRLSKRFLAQRSAELVDLNSGDIWRGADAETRAEALLHADGRGHLRGLVWVAQAESFALPKSDGDLGSAMSALIEQEAAAASGLGRARRVREQVAAQLGMLMTTRGPKAGGDLARAIEQRDAIRGRLEAAKARATAMAHRIEQLASLRAELENVAAPGVSAAARTELDAARKALAEAETARERKRTADAQVATRQLSRDAAASALERHDARVSDLVRAEAELTRLTAESEALLPRLAAAQDELQLAKLRRDDIAGSIANLRRLVTRREAAKLERRLETARDAASKVAALDDRLRNSPVGEAEVSELRRVVAEVAVLDARVAAGAPRLTVAYAADATGRIRISGRALDHGESLAAEGRLEIVIDGIGTISIEPAEGQAGDLIGKRDAGLARLQSLLAQLRVADIAQAEAALVSRRELERERAEGRAQLGAAAPDGIERLQRAVQDAKARSAGAAPDVDESGGQDLDERLIRLEQELASCEADASRKSAAAQALANERTRLHAETASLERRVSEAKAAAISGSNVRDALASELQSAEMALAETVREASSWALAVPTSEDHAALKRRVAGAETAVRTLESRRHEIERAISDREGALRRDGEDGTGGDVAGLEEQLASAEARVADLDLDVGALTLLATRLDAVAVTHRQHVLRPVIERLQPTLQRLHSDASVALDGPTLVARLERAGGAHTLQQLSDGTREQIAVLVRLAYAGLLADRGAAMPVVLDDALAFSDDQRFAAMLELMAEATARHQVIVLTCREQAVSGIADRIGAHRLEIQPWRDHNRVAQAARRKAS